MRGEESHLNGKIGDKREIDEEVGIHFATAGSDLDDMNEVCMRIYALN